MSEAVQLLRRVLPSLCAGRALQEPLDSLMGGLQRRCVSYAGALYWAPPMDPHNSKYATVRWRLTKVPLPGMPAAPGELQALVSAWGLVLPGTSSRPAPAAAAGAAAGAGGGAGAGPSRRAVPRRQQDALHAAAHVAIPGCSWQHLGNFSVSLVLEAQWQLLLKWVAGAEPEGCRNGHLVRAELVSGWLAACVLLCSAGGVIWGASR
jgi:hypothetical protein